jgi:hypothetical protein
MMSWSLTAIVSLSHKRTTLSIWYQNEDNVVTA